MKLIMEGWRDFLGKARKKPKPEEEEDEPSSVVKALMTRGGLTQKEAEEWLDSKQSTVELEEGFFERLHSQARIDSLVGTIRNATEEGMSPEKIEARLVDQGANFEEVMAALDQAFQEELSGEKLEEGVFDFLRGSSSKQKPI